MKHDNAAVFIGKSKKFSNVSVQQDGGTVRVLNRTTKQPIASFNIVATVVASSSRMSVWDVSTSEGTVRLAAVNGCGCGGLPPYTPDAGYTTT
jgi:hypothetical protein